MAKIEVTVLGETKTILYPDALEGKFLLLAAQAYGYPPDVPNPGAATDPTQPAMIDNPQSPLDFVLQQVTNEVVDRVKRQLLHTERRKADAAIVAAVDAQIGEVSLG
jgi:hypothetical protein